MLRLATSAALGGVLLGAMAYVHPLVQSELDCSGGGRLCPRVAEVESGQEKLTVYNERHARAGLQPGALRAAYEGTQALKANKADISGTSGTWRAYGRGPLISSGLAQTLGAGLGVNVPDTNAQFYSGRVDNFAYDPVAKRLFAAVGTGGIWMSEAVSGDVRTIGDLWVSIGDNLPYQANGGVIWTSAGGGTVISAGGDSVMSTGAYHGIGAFWSNDLGATWTRANGYPDDALVFNTATDPGNPHIVYIASSKGLFRSEDAGRNFSNVRLPTGVNGGVDCAGVEDATTPCNLANVVSEVVVQAPGGATNIFCSNSGCPVLAAVGWRAGALNYPNSEVPQSPANGLYRSDSGTPGSFVRLELPAANATGAGFAPQDRIGRIEMGAAFGPLQDHNYVYAMVQDAALLNGTAAVTLDPPLDALGSLPLIGATLIQGIYVSPDFGLTWRKMGSSLEIGTIPGPFAALIAPGAQSWYNQWVQPDPTRQVPVLGIPTRMAFGLEEVFSNIGSAAGIPLNGIAQIGPQDFMNVGYYFSATGADATVHADQHAGIWIPTGDLLAGGDGGVCLFAGHDGGVSRQCVLPVEELGLLKWTPGSNTGFNTLLPYGLGVAKDGTVWFGLQDNGSGHLDPASDGLGGAMYGDFGADGFYAEVDPDNSDLAYTEAQNGGLVRTTNRGATSTSIAPPYVRVNFANWFQMDPLDSKHMITTANQIFETLDAPNVTSSTWTEVYNLGFNENIKDADVLFTATVADVHGPAIYVGACGDCGVTANDFAFQNRIATNVGGSLPPSPGTSDGWHDATAAGLPNRLILSMEIDPDDAKTVYVGLGQYSSGLRGPGSFGEDSNGADVGAGNLFKSADAGETFVSIQGDLPSMPINSLLRRGSQLIAATDFGVFISSDLEGSSWAPMGTGLPAVPVSMIKLQPGNPNRMFISTFGRGFWIYDFPPDSQIAVAQAEPRARFGGALALVPMLLLLLAGAMRRSSR